METKVQKWGNGPALRIPKSFVTETRLEPDTEVDLSLVEGTLVITPVEKDYSLEGLLTSVTEENTHAKVDTGGSVGSEVWS